MTIWSRERARALWCRRSGSGPSFAARTKCPEASQVLCEHRDSLAGGARVIPEKSGEVGISQPSTRAAGRQENEGGIERSVLGLGGMLERTFRPDALIMDLQSLMP